MRSPTQGPDSKRAILVGLFLFLTACGGGGDSAPPFQTPPLVCCVFPTLAPEREMSYSGTPSLFDRQRNRFYAVVGNQIIALDPATGAQTVIAAGPDDAPDGPTFPYAGAGPSNQLALSASGEALYIVTKSAKLARLNLTTGLIEQRLELPAGPAGSTRRVKAVVASNLVDNAIYVAYFEITPVEPLSATIQNWLTKVDDAGWNQHRLELQNPSVLTMKPDDTEILLVENRLAGTAFRRIRVDPSGTLAFDIVETPVPYGLLPPAYVGTGILFKNVIYDAATLAKLHDLPGVSCSPLANPNHAVCVGDGEPTHALHVYDLARRQTLESWNAGLPPPASGLDAAGPTGWVSEAGPNRVVVHYVWNVYKGFNQTALYSYSHVSLN